MPYSLEYRMDECCVHMKQIGEAVRVSESTVLLNVLVLPLTLLFLFSCGSGPNPKSATTFHANSRKARTFGFYEAVNPSGAGPDTVLSGKYIEWDSLGRQRSLKNYRDGKLDGIEEDYFPNGKIRMRAHYSDGKVDNTLNWDEQGRLRERVQYKAGKATVFFIDEYGNETGGYTPVNRD
jgi:hypothetical protein